MSHRSILFCAIVALTPSVALAAPVPADATSPLAIVPSQCSIVLQVRGVDRVRDRLKAMLTAADPMWGGMAAAKVQSAMSELPDGRKLQGLAPGGPLFVAFLELPTAESENPKAAIIAKVKSFAEFRDGILTDEEKKNLKAKQDGIQATEVEGKQVYLIEKPDYAVVTMNEETAKVLAKPFAGLDKRLSGESASKFLSQDVSLFVDLAAVSKAHGATIAQWRDMMLAMMQAGAAGMDEKSLEMAKGFYGGIFQLILDGNAAVVALDFRPEGLAVHTEVNVNDISESNDIMKKHKPELLEQVVRLPEGHNIYFTAAESTQKTIGGLVTMNAGLTAASDAKGKALEAIETAKARMSMGTANYPLSGLTIQEFEDANRAMAGILDSLKSLDEGSRFSSGFLKAKPQITAAAQTHHGVQWTSVRLVWDLEKMASMIPGAGNDATELFKKIMGEELNTWIGVSGRRLIQVQAKDWKSAAEQLDQFFNVKKPVGESAAFKTTYAGLPHETSLLYFMDVGPTLLMTIESAMPALKAGAFLPFPIPDAIKPIDFKPAYIGFAATMRPQRGSIDIFVPVGAAAEVSKLVNQFVTGS